MLSNNNMKEIRLFHLHHLKIRNLVFIKSYFSLKFPDNTREDDKPKEISILNQTEKVFSLASQKVVNALSGTAMSILSLRLFTLIRNVKMKIKMNKNQ